MPPPDGTFLQAERERVIAICLARNAAGRGNRVIDAAKPCAALATGACIVP